MAGHMAPTVRKPRFMNDDTPLTSTPGSQPDTVLPTFKVNLLISVCPFRNPSQHTQDFVSLAIPNSTKVTVEAEPPAVASQHCHKD